MNQGVEPDISGAYQTLKYTKAKMREIIAWIDPNPKGHGRPLGIQVSIV